MQTRLIRPMLMVACGSVAALSAPAIAQVTLQKSNSISLSADFAAGSAYGTNPLSIAFNGTSAFVGGFNPSGGSTTVGVVRVDGIGTGTTTINPLASTQFGSPANRGIDSLAATSNGLFIHHFSGAASSTFVRRTDNDGNTVWSVSNVNNESVFAIAIDPLGNAGAPALAYLNQGSGFVRRLSIDDGSVITPSGQFGIGFNASLGSAHRALDFDDAGNIIYGTGNGVGVGIRDTAGGTNFNRVVTLTDPNVAGTSPSIIKSGGVNNVGNGVALVNGLATDPLIAFSPRATNPTTLTALDGSTTSVNPNNLQLRKRDGTLSSAITQSELLGNEDNFGNVYTDAVKNIAYGVDGNGNPVLLVVSFATRQLDVYTIEPEWTGTSGNWSQNTSWVGGVVPDSRNTNATFRAGITAPTTVTLDTARTVKQLKFDTANSVTVAGTNTLTLATPINNGSNTLPAYLTVKQGNHAVNAPIVFASNGRIDIATGSTLSLGTVNAPGRGLTVAPAGGLGSGTLQATHIRANTLVLNAGVTKITGTGDEAGISRVAVLQQAGGTLDLGVNGLIVDYAADASPSPFADLKARVLANAIFSSAADSSKVLGIAEVSALGAAPTFADPALITDSTTVLIRYTLKGDSDLNKAVNFNDLLALAQNYNGTGKEWSQGDFDYSGTVDFNDLLSLAQNYNGTLLADGALLSGDADFAADFALAVSLVPEPATLSMLAAGLLVSRRRRA
jgi:hypothetical protein